MKKILRKLDKDMKMSFQSCLETNTSGIGIAIRFRCLICKVCSNLVHSIDWVNSNIALEEKQLLENILKLPEFVSPPMAITPLPVGDVTIAGLHNFKGKFGPEI